MKRPPGMNLMILLFLALSSALFISGVYGLSGRGHIPIRVLSRILGLEIGLGVGPGLFGSSLLLGSSAILVMISLGLIKGSKWAIYMAAIFGGLFSFVGLLRMLDGSRLGVAYLFIGLAIVSYLAISGFVRELVKTAEWEKVLVYEKVAEALSISAGGLPDLLSTGLP